MINVLTIGSDRNLFKKESQVRARVSKQGGVFDQLHVVVFSLSETGLKSEKIAENVWIYPTNSSSRLLYIRDAIALSKKIFFDNNLTFSNTVVSAQDPFEAGITASFVSGNLKIPLHLQIHTDFLSPFFRRQSLLNRLRVSMARLVLPKADGIRVVSERIAESIKKSDIKLKTNPIILPVFADFYKISDGTPSFDLHVKYPNFKSIVLMVGRLSPEKNILSALNALALVVKKYPNIGMVIVGDGPDKANLILRAKNLGIGKNVVFESWQEDLVSFYKTANLFVLASNYEGYGLVLIEAAAAGCPIITTDVGIAREMLGENHEQFIYPVGDEKCLAGKIILLLEDVGLRRKYSVDLSLWTANQYFPNIAEYLKRYQKLLEDCLKDERGAK